MTIEKLIQKIRKNHPIRNEMNHKGFTARLMRAERLKDTGYAHGLPPGLSIDVFDVDALPGSPKEWVGGTGSYVCPVSPEWGLWFDWTSNDNYNTAVLASVKGMNPVTGQKIEALSLESYEEECPVHKSAFKGARLCEQCGYRWPPKNYICYPDTLWWDGFRQPDGTVRQFFFTEDEERDIASYVIGKENTVPAFGFAFFETVERREIKRELFPLKSVIMDYGPTGPIGITGPIVTGTGFDHYSRTIRTSCANPSSRTFGCNHVDLVDQAISIDPVDQPISTYITRSIKDVSVGAGAEIRQDLSKDVLKLTDWKRESSAIIRLYFVFAKQFESIVSNGGIKDLDGNKEGFLKGLPVG